MRLLLYISVFILAGCTGSKKLSKTEEQKPAPTWISNRPLDANHYLGIGFANKLTYPTDYALIAKKSALSDMSSEIQINISGESFFQTIDSNNEYKDEFQSMIRSSFEEEIKDYDIVDSYETESEYWIFTRISKAKHRSIKEEKKQKLLTQVYDGFKKAQSFRSEGKLEDALDVLTKSLMNLKEYWAEDNTFESPEGALHLDNEIYNEIREICSSFRIQTESSELTLDYLNKFSLNLGLIVESDGDYIPGIPVNYKFTHTKYKRTKTVYSGNNGTAAVTVEPGSEYKKNFYVNLWVDVESMLRNGEYPEIEELLVKSINQPIISVPVNVELPKVFFIPKEDEENKLVEVMKNELQKNNFTVVSDSSLADLEIDITSSTSKGGSAQGFKVALLDFSIAMQNHDNQTILYSDSFTNIKGLHLNYTGAIGEAYNNGQKKIRKEVVPRILEVIL